MESQPQPAPDRSGTDPLTAAATSPGDASQTRPTAGQPTGRQPQSFSERSRYQPLVPVAVGLAGGILVDHLADVPLSLAAVGLAAALASWSLAAWLRHWAMAGAVLLSAVALLGALWHHLVWNLFSPHDLGRYATRAGGPVALEVVAESGVRHYPPPEFDPLRAYSPGSRSRLLVRGLRLRQADRWQAAQGLVQLEVDGQLLGIEPGDRLMVYGRLVAPLPQLNPLGWDGAAFLRADRILCRVRAERPECVRLVERGSRWNLTRLLARVRAQGDHWLWTRLDRQRTGLAAALLLGIREQLDEPSSEAFVRTGTVHLLAISGMHVAILVGPLWWAVNRAMVPRRPGLFLVAAAATGYALLTEAEPPVLRAAVVVAAVCLAAALGRRVPGFQALALAALVVLALNPLELFRVGTQLSFLCVAALIVAGRLLPRPVPPDPLERLIANSRRWPVRAGRQAGAWVLRSLYFSAAVWLATLPLVAARFHLVSPVALLLNLVLLPLVAVAMFAGAALLTIGWLVPALAGLAAACCDASLAGMDHVVSLASGWPGAYRWVAGPGPLWLATGYALLGVAVAWRRVPRNRGGWVAAWILWWAAAGLAGGHRPPPDTLRVTLLAVGHGSASVIELPDGRTMLFDAGQLGSPERCAETVAGLLWSEGITRIDAAIVSHEDVDHFNALPELMRRIPIERVYLSPAMRFEGAAAGVLLAALERERVPIERLSAGDELPLPAPSEARVLHPPATGVSEANDNAQSLVIEWSHGGPGVLLTGDLEPPGTTWLLAQPPRTCSLLAAPHHGSPRSNPQGVAEWCRPHWVVISGGYSAGLDGVRAAYAAQGAQVLHTTADGAVRWESRGGRARCWRFVQGAWREMP